jgi:hypothetical protein
VVANSHNTHGEQDWRQLSKIMFADLSNSLTFFYCTVFKGTAIGEPSSFPHRTPNSPTSNSKFTGRNQ